jgi:hypothetical protein
MAVFWVVTRRYIPEENHLRLDLSDSGQGPVELSCEHSNETFGSIKVEGCLYGLCDCQVLEDSAPWSYNVLLTRL